MSPQAVYQHRKRQIERQQALQPLIEWIQFYRMLMPRIGGRKLYSLIKPKLLEHNIKLGRDAFFDFLREQGLLVKPKRSYTKTTFSKHWMRKHPNLLKDAKSPNKPEQVFVADITYVTSKQGTHYLSLVTDAYSRKIIGYHLSDDMPAAQVVKALQVAVKNKQYQHPCIHHSDRGLQYCANEYQQVLTKANITPSMTDGYDCYQNALAERINGILKAEFLLYDCNSFNELKQFVDESIYIYNHIRPHLSLNMKTPEQVHQEHLTEINTNTQKPNQKQSQIHHTSG